MKPSSFLILSVTLLLTTCQFSGKEPISYNRDVRPIFNENCLSCHGGVKQLGGFSLLFESDAFQETESGKRAIVRGDHSESELYKRLIESDAENRMPQEHPPLSENEINIIRQWIDEGAKWEKHWAYISPVNNTNFIEVTASDWGNNEIDHFVFRKLSEKGLKPNQQADKSTLIRRVYLDLIGLPPSLEEAQSFINNEEDSVYEKVVDQLLQSPHFGEHWAAMWLDLARYGDSQGYQKDIVRKHIWRYRDWVIHAFNQDMPFDQFTIEQLAGDLLPNPSDDQLLATAFHRNTNTNTEGGTDDEEFRTYAVMDRLNTTFEIWQGMTMSCVQCHSHPYDPIRHEEFYQGLAYFNNTADKDLGNEFPRKTLLSPGQKHHINRLKKEIDIQKHAGDTLSESFVKLVSQMEVIQPAGVPVMQELEGEEKRISHIFERGNWLMKGKEVCPNIPKILPATTNQHGANRLDLAEWLVSNENPLTARVIVNRFWANIFGIGLVETVEDFGTQGAKPVNQELLDWLSLRFMHEHQWSLKALLKDIVLSSTYQQSSTVTPEKLEIDPDNQLLSRGARFRLSAEQTRDQALMVSGLFHPEIYGPSVMPHLPDGVYSVIRHAHKWETSAEGHNHRRGVYTFWRKTSPYPSMITFDTPSREFCVSRRVRTNTPLQAMVTLNDPVYLETAIALAEKIHSLNNQKTEVLEGPDVEQLLSYGFELLLFKKPTPSQLQELFTFYKNTLKHYQQDPAAVGELVPQGTLQTAEMATLINVANVLMNMDEFLMKN